MKQSLGQMAGILAAVISLTVSVESKAQPAARAKSPATATATPTASTGVANDPDRDRAVIDETLRAFAGAFATRDAKAVSAHWTTAGELETVRGITIRGREAIEKSFTDFFANTPEVQADISPDSVRFLSENCAIATGRTTIRKGAAASRSHYTALMVRENGRWLLATLSEVPDDTQSIEDLAWLIGDWKSVDGGGAEIQSNYAWDASKKFLRVQFTLTEGKRTLSGSQMIGVDPATGKIHSWTFEATGGVGEADWNPDGDHWILHSDGTLPDGSSLQQSNILRRINDDTFTWQSIDRTFNGRPIADLAPVKVTRTMSK